MALEGCVYVIGAPIQLFYLIAFEVNVYVVLLVPRLPPAPLQGE